MEPLISVGIPTCNRADTYLPVALESALAQTYSNFEVIVADNGSTDGTRELVASYGSSRLRYFRHEPSLHYNENFNFCLRHARGEYFQLLHDDDLIDPTFLESCKEGLAKCGSVGIVRTGVRTVDGDGAALRSYPNEDQGLDDGEFIRRWLQGRSMLILCSTLFNTKALRAEGGFHSKKNLFQDVLAELSLARKHGRADVRAVRASFRKHGAQNTNANKIGDWCDDSLFLLERIRELYGSDDAELEDMGLVHFAKHNYDLASGIQDRGERYRAYWAIHRRFGRRLSPLSYFYQQLRRQTRTRLGARKRAAVRVLAPYKSR